MTFTRLWPSLVLENMYGMDNTAILADLVKSNSFQYDFDHHSIKWSFSDTLMKVRGLMVDAAVEWMNEARVTKASLGMTSSWASITQPLQGTPFHNNHNCELVVLYWVTTGLENGVKIDRPIFPASENPINTPFGSPSGKNSIILQDPRGTAVTIEENGFKSFYEVEPKQGMLMAFPSYIPYYFLPNVGSTPRIVLVGNFEIE